MEIKKITGKISEQFTLIPLKEEEKNQGEKSSQEEKKPEKLDSKDDNFLFHLSLILFVFVLLALFIVS